MGNVNSKSQDVDDFLNDLAMHETTMSLGLCIVCLMYSFKGLSMLKWLDEHSENTNTNTNTVVMSAKFQHIQRIFFYIQNLLFAIIIRCCGRYPSSPYSNNHNICVYQGVMENTGGYASFLLSLTLALLVNHGINMMNVNHNDNIDETGKFKKLQRRLINIVKRFIKWWTSNGKWSVAIIYGISIIFATVISYLSNFCHAHNTNAKRRIHLVFYVPLVTICFSIIYIFGRVWKNLGDKLHLNDPCKLLCCYRIDDESDLHLIVNSNLALGATSEVWRKIEKLVLLTVLFFPLIMIICFTPGIIKKMIDYITEDNTPFIFKFFHIAFQCIYGAIVATTCFYIIYYNTKLSLLKFNRLQLQLGRDEASVAFKSPRTTITQMNAIADDGNNINTNDDVKENIEHKIDDDNNDDVHIDQDDHEEKKETMVRVAQATMEDEKEVKIVDVTVQLHHYDYDRDAESCDATKGKGSSRDLETIATSDNPSSHITVTTTNNETDLLVQKPRAPSIQTTTIQTIDIEAGLVAKVEISTRKRRK